MLNFIFLFVFGAMIGSFLNVCIYRIPKRQSIILPNSHCPKCNTPIKWYDNIPIISFILLGQKCRYCKGKISFKYFLVEVSTPIMLILLYKRYFFTLEFFINAVLFLALIVLFFIDLEHQILPDRITYPLLIAGIATSMLRSEFNLKESLFGALIGGGFLYLIVVLSRGGMGLGDVKLSAAIGAFLGWRNTIDSLFIAFLLGGIVGIILLISGIKKRKDPIPFGPFIAAGVFISVLSEISFIRTFF